MKKCLIMLLILSKGLIMESGVINAQVIMPVKDENKLHQIQREVAWTEWEGHTPKWFYWVMELFQKDNYRDKDRRNILQLLPTLAALRYNESETETYKEDVENWEKQELFKLADLEIDVAYAMIKKDLTILRGQWAKTIKRAIVAGTYTEMVQEIFNERDRIEGRIYTLHESDIPNVDRREEYFNEMKAYKRLIELTNRIAKAFELVNKLKK
jgi:hypothetical protein